MLAHEDPRYSRCEFAEHTILSGSVVPDSGESERRLRAREHSGISPAMRGSDVRTDPAFCR